MALQDPQDTTSISRFEVHGLQLAEIHQLKPDSSRGHNLSLRLWHNEKILEKSLTTVSEEWADALQSLLLRGQKIRDDLNPELMQTLPKVGDDSGKVFPRIYAVAAKFTILNEHRFDPSLVRAFLGAYQKKQPFTLTELHQLATAFWFTYIENLSRCLEQKNPEPAVQAKIQTLLISTYQMKRLDWQELFEELSLVERNLRAYPPYTEMDATTRHSYREAIAELARYSPHSEWALSEMLAQENGMDPGYYLIAGGRKSFEQKIQYAPPFGVQLRHFYRKNALRVYLLSVLVITMSLLALAVRISPTPPLWTGLFLFLGLFPASEIATLCVQRLSALGLGSRRLPRYDYKSGVPAHARTLIVLPTVLTSEAHLQRQLEQLEIHSLSNPEKNISLALLTDWLDSNEEIVPQDLTLLELASKKLAALNAKHRQDSESGPKFYIFHRPRRYNENRGLWMGWKRKRGKLFELNRLLQGHRDTSFISLDEDELRVPPDIKYVITLDPGTRLPKGAAAQLIGTMAHPLNQPVFDESKRRVVQGYGLLQPRIVPTLPLITESTLFQELSNVSETTDAYQDLFNVGTSAGEGIYDVALFATQLHSHNLLAENYGRCGFVGDIELFEDFPSHTEVAASRQQRWARRDWKLLPWILGRGGTSVSALSRWKMIESLRRSLMAPMNWALLVTALSFSHSTTAWVLLPLFSGATPILLNLLGEVQKLTRKVSWQQNMLAAFEDLKQAFQSYVLFLALLPHRSALALQALYQGPRLKPEDTSAMSEEPTDPLSWSYFLKSFRKDAVLLLITLAAFTIFQPVSLYRAFPILLLWVLAPVIARHASSPPKPKLLKPLDFQDVQLLQNTARRIWQFFTTFVTREDHDLPPNNFQETPHPAVAHRSSPTNFGLYLMSILAAKDFGWIGTSEAVDRLEKTLRSLEKLPRHQGHFFNWYETREGRPLEPLYISSVDSGTLAAHLLAVEQGCLEILDAPLTYDSFAKSLLKTLDLCEGALQPFPKSENMAALLREFKLNIIKFDRRTPVRFARWETVVANARDLLHFVEDLDQKNHSSASKEALIWAQAVFQDATSTAEDLKLLFLPQDLAQIFFVGPAEQQREWDQIQERAAHPVPLKDLETHYAEIVEDILMFKKSLGAEVAGYMEKINAFRKSVEDNIEVVRGLRERLQSSVTLCDRLFREMNFQLLYDPSRRLFSEGYWVEKKELDENYYDLLASEARLTSFIAIAKGEVATFHWFQLGRGLAYVKNGPALVSWTGSMFEYLMPSLVMPSPEGSLVEKTCQSSVLRQIQYGSEKKVPWGISDSAYNQRDSHLGYQSAHFGIPDLGLKSSTGADLVVAPYATFLAAMYETLAAVENLRHLQQLGGQGVYGFYEAIDFTPSRLPEGQTEAVIRTYMAHHQGMSLIALTNVLRNGIMRTRFQSHPLVQSAELLLQERMPKGVGFAKTPEKSSSPTEVSQPAAEF